ncbi:hypothetical protein ACLESO_43690 [Pyxidicoccus sp. 3LG]
MAKRTRIIEGTWNCTSCDTKGIPARHKLCPNCNNPRELTGKESEFDFGGVDEKSGKSLREGVTDQSALEIAGAGEDWFCAYCGAANRGDTPRCKQCSAERTPDAKAAPIQAFDAPQAPPPAPTPKKGMGKTKWIALAAVFSCCFSTCLFGVWAGSTDEFPGEVTGTSWKRAVVQERFTPVSKTGWRDELSSTAPRMPVNGAGEVAGVANVRDCVSRQRRHAQGGGWHGAGVPDEVAQGGLRHGGEVPPPGQGQRLRRRGVRGRDEVLQRELRGLPERDALPLGARLRAAMHLRHL